jgi:GT2 family glycosyltransferase
MNRPLELQRLLSSMECQSVLPDEVIIVDGSAEPIDRVLKDFSKLNLKYVRVVPPSLSRQRNAGLAEVSCGISLVGFLDDDLVMEPGSIDSMLRFWDRSRDHVGGASFNISNSRPPRALLIKSLFRMDSFRRGAVMSSGYEASIPPVVKDTYVDWLSGAATVWRREVVEEFKYDEWFQGYSYFEDVDYSYRVGRKYRLVVLANARVEHMSRPVKADRNYEMGKCQVINRRYFLQKHRHMSAALFYWATLGLMIANIGEGILLKNPRLFTRTWGNIVGLFQCSFGRLQQINTHLKD